MCLLPRRNRCLLQDLIAFPQGYPLHGLDTSRRGRRGSVRHKKTGWSGYFPCSYQWSAGLLSCSCSFSPVQTSKQDKGTPKNVNIWVLYHWLSIVLNNYSGWVTETGRVYPARNSGSMGTSTLVGHQHTRSAPAHRRTPGNTYRNSRHTAFSCGKISRYHDFSEKKSTVDPRKRLIFRWRPSWHSF